MKNEENAKIFKALCDEKRLSILELLQQGEKCACHLIESTGIAQSALSYHMKILCDSKLVVAIQKGKWTHYRLDQEGASRAIDILKQITTSQEETM